MNNNQLYKQINKNHILYNSFQLIMDYNKWNDHYYIYLVLTKASFNAYKSNLISYIYY